MKIDLSLHTIRPIPLAAAAILLLHALASALHPADSSVTYYATLLANAIALFACLRRASSTTDIPRLQWQLFAAFLFSQYLGAIILHLPFAYYGLPKLHIGPAELAALVRALPIVAAICLPEITRSPTQDSRFSLWLASLQTLLFLGLADYALFYLQAFGPVHPLPGAFPTTHTFYAESCILALAVILRYLARSAKQCSTFYAPVALYLGGTATVGFLLPRFHAAPASLLYLASDSVILAFALYVGHQPADTSAPKATAASLYLNLFGPAVFPLTIFCLAIPVLDAQRNLGLQIMALSLGLFALRTTSLQAGYRRMKDQMVEDNQATILEARIDQLTGIPNRRSFDRTIDREWRRAERTHQPIGLLMVDVDKFKHLNDTQGHPAGDRCLKRIAQVLDAKLTRATDFVARYGGEEFAVVLTDTSVADIKAIAESLRQAVAEARLPNATDIGQYVSISIGAALTYPAPPLTPSSLLSGADQALYQAKRNGRNRVHFTNLLEAPSARAQSDGALQSLITNYKESLYGTEPDPLANRDRIRSITDRRSNSAEHPTPTKSTA